MGQAKARGSFEQRQAVAIAKAEAAAIERQRLREERRRAEHAAEMALPEKQRAHLRAGRMRAHSLLAMAVGLIVASPTRDDAP